MAVYKVPQDVEADDKLLGPFSFRQFIYLIIVAMAIGVGYVLSQIFVGLVVIVLPIIVFFGALALPLKKDQPMEAYLGALISFYFLKPRKRFWQPDGLDSLIEITAPKTLEPELTKDISQDEAKRRLGYLTDIVESEGWAVRGVGVQQQGIASMNEASYNEAVATEDILDDTTVEAQKIDQILDTRDEQGMEQVRTNFQQQMAAPPPETVPQLQYNPYPPIHQTVVQPTAAPNQTPDMSPVQNTSTNTPSPDIIKLIDNSEELTVDTVGKLAHRIEEKHGLPDEEVEISLH